jgi:hypothetical protein
MVLPEFQDGFRIGDEVVVCDVFAHILLPEGNPLKW